MRRSLDEVQRDLGHLEGALAGVVDGGWDLYTEKHRDLRGGYHLRAQAMLVHIYMEQTARSTLDEISSISMPVPGSQLFYINFENKYLIKPRKLNPDFTVVTNWTALGFDFEDQDSVQMTLPGMPDPVTKLHLGYLLNPAKSGYSSIHIVSPDGVGRVEWEWTVASTASDSGPIRFPVTPPPDGGRLAWPKREEKPEVKRSDGTDT